MTRFLREPLFHFLVLGVLMFAAYFVMQDNRNYHPPGSIAVTPGRIQQMSVAFEAANGRKPTSDEVTGLIDSYVHDEVFVREALKLGLDQDDPVIRATLIEKARGLADFAADTTEPTDADLQVYLDANAATFTRDGLVPPLADIRDAVRAAVIDARRQAAEEAFYAKAKAEFVIEIVLPEPKT